MHYTRKQTAIKAPPHFYVPVDLDPLIFQKEHRQYVAYFLNLLHWKQCCWEANEKGYIPLKKEYLKRVIPAYILKVILARLVGRDIIWWNWNYVEGVTSMSYQIKPAYRKTKRIECTNTKLIKKIQAVYQSESIPLNPTHRWLGDKLQLIEFDMEQAEKIINTLEPDNTKKISTNEYRFAMTAMCQRIFNCDGWFVVDRFGRVHTPITSLAKELRECIKVEGQKLVNIDLANSQPLIAGLIGREYYANRKKAARLRNRVFQEQGNPYHNRRLEPTTPDLDHPDLEKYIQICEAGLYYDSMMKEGDDRAKFKEQCLTSMYSKNNKRSNPLKTTYPSVANMLHALKNRDYRHAAHLMQNVEATIFIGVIAERIRQERPNIPIITIHDSILTLPCNAPYVKAVIMDVFQKIGVKPLLRMED